MYATNVFLPLKKIPRLSPFAGGMILLHNLHLYFIDIIQKKCIYSGWMRSRARVGKIWFKKKQNVFLMLSNHSNTKQVWFQLLGRQMVWFWNVI